MTTTTGTMRQYSCKNHAEDIYEGVLEAEQRALPAEVLWNLIDEYGLVVVRVLRAGFDLGLLEGELTLMDVDDLADLDPSEYVAAPKETSR